MSGMPQPTSERDAEELLTSAYGLAGTATRLPSEVDETFTVTSTDGRQFVLKLAGRDERQDVLAFQLGALVHLAATAPDLPVPRVIAPLAGGSLLPAEVNGHVRAVRLLSYLDGTQLAAVPPSIPQMLAVGQRLAELDLALGSYKPTIPEIDLIWDLSRAARIAALADHVEENQARRFVFDALTRFTKHVLPIQPTLPRQVFHNDFNPSNILVADADPTLITGIIDFGDMIEGPRVNDLAVALCYQLGRDDGIALALALNRGYRRLIELTDQERAALPVLVEMRLAMTVAITSWRAANHPERAAYVLRNRPAALTGLTRLNALSAGERATLFEEVER